MTPHLICRLINPEIRVKCFQPLTILNGYKMIRNFDQHMVNKNLKFGIIYMKKGQTTEEELFSNQEHSESFDKFLNLIGKRIKLKDFDGFRGGLDISNGQTGEYSVYESYKQREIMFHVSTLLPFSKTDQQQLERKRHIGNDIVAIVYQEDNTPFAPDMIASNFLHAFIVIQKLTVVSGAPNRYKVSVTARKDVPNFGPPISSDSIYDECDPAFKEWILNKLINAELSCYKAEKFRKLNERTRYALLDALHNDLNEQNQRVLQSLQQSSDETHSFNESTHSSTRLTEHRHSIDHLVGSSLLLGTSTNNLTSNNGSTSSTTSAAFKFSLINTVRKAFKKEGKSLPLVANTPASAVTTPTNGTKPFEFPSPETTINEPVINHHNPIAISRFRSSTFDAGSFTLNSKINKQILEPQQAQQLFSKKSYLPLKVENDKTKNIESNDSLNNIDLAFNSYKHQLKYTGSTANDRIINQQKLLTTTKPITNKYSNEMELVVSDNSKTFDEHRSSTSSTASTTSSSSSSSTSSSHLNDYSPTKENQTKINSKNSDLNDNQKLNLHQRIQQKRHSLSIK